MQCTLFVFRHAETTDNARKLFSGWRNPKLTEKGIYQANQTASQLKHESINYAFTSHLRRARETLATVLKHHPNVPVFVDDRLIERCYGLLQGRSKTRVAKERPAWFAKVHRGYDFPPPQGESLKMVLHRTLSFLEELKTWLQRNPGNVAISCHGNSMRPIRKVFENLSIKQMCKIENPQDTALSYALAFHKIRLEPSSSGMPQPEWKRVRVPDRVKLATDPRNPLVKYY